MNASSDSMRFTRTLRIAAFGALACACATGARAQATELVITHADPRPSSVAMAEHFTGKVHVRPAFATATRASGASVTFEAGARTDWHTHPRGQVLIVTDGIGRVRRWGGPVEEIRPGDVVRIPPNVKHWHGAAPTTAMTHLAIVEPLDGRTVVWLERVSDEQYGGREVTPAAASGPSRAQQLMGDIAPKLAQLTDSVLYADIWARPGLSTRDRSLVTVSALIAMNRPDQLRSHIVLARQNGVTEEEIVEAITQLAFYAGWPNALTAVGVAREVFAKQ
jgi:4-carboxymuconolactone decarboxylase